MECTTVPDSPDARARTSASGTPDATVCTTVPDNPDATARTRSAAAATHSPSARGRKAAEAAAEAAVKAAVPLAENGYKAPLVRGILEETLIALAA